MDTNPLTICYSINPPLIRPFDNNPSYGYKSPDNMLLGRGFVSI
jgi:hypothetical protein